MEIFNKRIIVFADCNGKMGRKIGVTFVNNASVFGNHISVVEKKAIGFFVSIFQGFQEADIHQDSSVKDELFKRFYQINGV